jgi:hypothetical protein
VRRAAGPFPPSLSSVCFFVLLLCFPFFSARLSLLALLQQNAKKKHKIGCLLPCKNDDKKRKNIKTEFVFINERKLSQETQKKKVK